MDTFKMITPKKNYLTQSKTPGIVFQPETYHGLLDGINQIINAIRPTLGPLPRYVALEQSQRNRSPEILDKGALIARRITNLADADADVGAMMLRHMLWKQYETVGDGTVTAGLIFQAIINEGIRYIVAGGDAMRLKTHLLEGLQIANNALKKQASAISGREQIEKVALTICHNDHLANILGEAFDVLGIFGKIDIHTGHHQQTEHEYIQGVLWEGGIQSPGLILNNLEQRTVLNNAAIFISDLAFDDPRELLPMIDIASKKYQALIIVCSHLSENALSLLNHINTTQENFKICAVKISKDHVKRIHMLEELSIMTGGQAYLEQTQDIAENIQAETLGYVSLAWANKDFFCIVEDHDGGQSRANFLLNLETRYQNSQDSEIKKKISERIGHLMGASVTIKVGGFSENDIRTQKEFTKNVVTTLRTTLDSGVVPGGGIALLHCKKKLQETLSYEDCPEKRAAFSILITALEQPFRQIINNAGLETGNILASIESAPDGSGYDVIAENLVDMHHACILDSLSVIACSLENAVRTAALTLTIDTIVHHRHPEFSNTP